MSLDLDLKLYFWIVDRLELEDDPRNKVNSESQTVSIGKVMAGKLRNGFLVSKLLQKMQSTFTKRTKHFFHFNQALFEMKDNDSVAVRRANWGLLSQEIKHFSITVDPAALGRIIDGNAKDL